MSNISNAIWVEGLKARRSRIPMWTALAFLLGPLAGGFFMIVMKDPDLARRLVLISAKAHIVAGSADWGAYLGLLAQTAAIGGLILFSFVASWVFGREYSDRTVKDLIALPTSRSITVYAKFVIVILWSGLLTLEIYLAGLGVGMAVGLPRASPLVLWEGTITIAISACLTIAVVTPVAFAASAGRGYLPGMGFAILLLVLAQIVAAAGWGEFFPWSVPALRAGMAGAQYEDLGVLSYLLVILTSVVGMVGTLAWWELADQK